MYYTYQVNQEWRLSRGLGEEQDVMAYREDQPFFFHVHILYPIYFLSRLADSA
jgi:hypothetical protein